MLCARGCVLYKVKSVDLATLVCCRMCRQRAADRLLLLLLLLFLPLRRLQLLLLQSR